MQIINLILSVLSVSVFAGQSFTSEEVAKHNATTDCYMVFEDKVYDVTDYLREHNSYYYNINSWCGKDMTEDFQTKDGRGQDHSSRTYQLLNDYYIGDLVTAVNNESTSNTIIQTTDKTTSSSSVKSPYNFILPLLSVLATYFLTEVIVKIGKDKNNWKFNKITEKFFWNTVMILSLIPSVLFGFYLVLRYQLPILREIQFNFLYWHVEGSIVFGSVCVIHFIERIKTYLAQINSLRN